MIQLKLYLQLQEMCRDREGEERIEVLAYTDVDYVDVEDEEILHMMEDLVCSNHDIHCMVMSTCNFHTIPISLNITILKWILP